MIRVVTNEGEAIAPDVEVRPDVVAHLERLLQRAKDGQVRSIAFVAEGPHDMDGGYCGVDSFYEGIYLLGCLERLKQQVMTRVDHLAEAVSKERT